MKDIRGHLPVIFLLLCAICASSWPLSFINKHLPADYSVFWAAAKMALDHPQLIYNDAALTLRQVEIVGAAETIRPWAYPPSALLPLLPFSMLPYQASLAVFVLVTGGLFLVATAAILPRRKALALALVVASQPVIFAALNGQMIFLVGALAIGGVASLPKSPIRAGILLGLAAAIKPQLMLFAPLALLADRQFRALGASICAGSAMVLLSLIFGFDRWIEWIGAIARFKATVASLDILYRNVTPTGILWFLGLEGPAQLFANAMFALTGAWMVWTVFRRSDELPPRIVALAGGGLFAAPYAMNYDLVLLVPAAAAFIVNADSESSPLLPALIGGILLVANGLWTPAVTMIFMVAAVWPYLRPVPWIRRRPESASELAPEAVSRV